MAAAAKIRCWFLISGNSCWLLGGIGAFISWGLTHLTSRLKIKPGRLKA